MKNTRTPFGSVCGSAEIGAHRAATGRERRADVTLCDYASGLWLRLRYAAHPW
ncbi:MAG TPA: hypothetical protein VGQ81_05630 [Acidobacteriota bacterium]|nr:hypothetical protein [Acidobacteriota bacterium]